MAEIAPQIARNLAAVRERIARAADTAGRKPSDVRLVAVTKYVGMEEIRAIVAAGCTDLGESRPQALWEKAASCTDPQIQWHLVGALQRNKVARTLPLVSLIHSVDSARLAATIDEHAARLRRTAPILVEVNVSGDAAKHGVPPGDLPGLLEQISRCQNVEVNGLMTLAALEGGPERARHDFAQLRELRDRMAASAPPNVRLGELSMGMSGDFEQAIAEGATIVRVGAALFEGLEA
jgi:pyridoxal phosphate enzyme (YggS family)